MVVDNGITAGAAAEQGWHRMPVAACQYGNAPDIEVGICVAEKKYFVIVVGSDGGFDAIYGTGRV